MLGHVLARHGIPISASEPEGAAPVSLVGELIGAALHYGDIGLVTGERSKAFGKLVVRTRSSHIGKPGFLGHTEAHAQEDAAFGRNAGSRGSCRSKALKAKRF